MKHVFFALLLVLFNACQTAKIKSETYKIAKTSPELCSIGQSKTFFKLQNSFQTKGFPKLENKSRLEIEVVPFTKKLSEQYTKKIKYNQDLQKLTYVDSLPTKAELVTIQLLDITGFVNELNADYNNDIFRIINNLQNIKLVTSIAVYLTKEEISKIKQVDSYYLTNLQDKKYTIALYKQGKKTESINIDTEAIIAYKLSSFCWAETERSKWYIADIIAENSSCKGITINKVKEKKREQSLFRM